MSSIPSLAKRFVLFFHKHKVHLTKKTIWIIEGSVISFAVVTALGYIVYHGGTHNETTTKTVIQTQSVLELSCDNGYSITPTYYEPDEKGEFNKLSLLITKQETVGRYEMTRISTETGALYKTYNNKYTFWGYQGTYILGINGVSISGCTLFTNKYKALDTRLKNSTYSVDGQTFTLTNGERTVETLEGVQTKSTLSLFGEPLHGDLDEDGDEDAAFILKYDKGGDSIRYYSVFALLGDASEFKNTNSVLLGSNIVPQTLALKEGYVAYNFSMQDLSNFDSTSTIPNTQRISTTTWIYYDKKSKLIKKESPRVSESVSTKNMTLSMKKWEWVRSETVRGEIITPLKDGVFILTLDTLGGARLKTDCNILSGGYSTQGDTVQFKSMIATRMFCEGSQENVFADSFDRVGTYYFTEKGELVLKFLTDKGMMVFK